MIWSRGGTLDSFPGLVRTAARMAVRVPLIRAVVARMAAALLERIGAPVERLLERARLSPRALENPESLVSFPGLARFLEEAARTQGIEDFGMRLGAASQPQQLGTFGRLIGQAFTLEEALDTAHRNYGNFSTGERPWLSRAAGAVHVHNRFVPAADDS